MLDSNGGPAARVAVQFQLAKLWCVLLSVLAAAIAALAIWGAIYATRSGIYKQAIDAGVAEWRADPKTGRVTFHWLPPVSAE